MQSESRGPYLRRWKLAILAPFGSVLTVMMAVIFHSSLFPLGLLLGATAILSYQLGIYLVGAQATHLAAANLMAFLIIFLAVTGDTNSSVLIQANFVGFSFLFLFIAVGFLSVFLALMTVRPATPTTTVSNSPHLETIHG